MPRSMENVGGAVHLVTRTFFGPRGVWVLRAYEAINAQLFAGALPMPLVTLHITAHGACLAFTRSARTRPPVINIHPSLFGGTEKDDPWGIPPPWLGERYVLDVLIHECIHVAVHYCLGGAEGPTSHNNPQWVGEVNRLAPLLGFDGLEAGMSTTKRVPIDGPPTARGKRPTRVERVTDGNCPFEAVAGFPAALRVHLGTADAYYTQGTLPVRGM